MSKVDICRQLEAFQAGVIEHTVQLDQAGFGKQVGISRIGRRIRFQHHAVIVEVVVEGQGGPVVAKLDHTVDVGPGVWIKLRVPFAA